MNIISSFLSKNKFASLVLFFFCSLSAIGQGFYPIQVQPTVVAPSIYLSDFTSASNVKVKVSLKDLSKDNYKFILKVKLVGSNNTTITSINGIQMTLSGGEVYYLNDFDLQEIFKASNLNLGSYNAANALPEGAYVLTFEAFDINYPTIPVSNGRTDFAQMMVTMNEPPLLTLPTQKTLVDLKTSPQNILFSWTPRHFLISPSQKVKYAFKIVEVFPVDRNPYDAINAANVFIGGRVFDDIEYPSFVWDPTFAVFEEGKVYAWQVTAYEEILTNGQVVKTSARFKQSGKSDVFTFSIKENCDNVSPILPAKITIDPLSLQGVVALEWNKKTGHTEYEIKFRPAGSVSPWTTLRQVENKLELNNEVVNEGVQYEYSISAKCKNWLPSEYGGMFTLEKASCTAPTPIKIANNSPSGIVLEWENTPNATAYNIWYKDLNTTKESSSTLSVVDITKTNTLTLAHLTSGKYEVKIDAVCGTLTAQGTKQDLNFDETGILGPCPLPKPFQLSVTRVESELHLPKPQADLMWTSTPNLYENYTFSYTHKDSLNFPPIVLTTKAPNVQAPKVLDNELYRYTLTFNCGNNKTVSTPSALFLLENLAGKAPNIAPGTANCFPPAEKNAEVRSESSANLEWTKVNDASEYQLFYAKTGTNDFRSFITTAGSAKLKDLEAGQTYEYKVRCRCGANYSIFSDLGSFDLSKPASNANCDSLAFTNIKKTTKTEVQLSWENKEGDVTAFNIYYKEGSQTWKEQYFVNLSDRQKFSISTDGTAIEYTIVNLAPDTRYDFKVQAVCGTDKALTNEMDTARTKIDLKKGDCESGKACDRSNTNLVASLQAGDKVFVADYSMILSEVTKNGDLYSGKGIAEAPFIGYSENIKIGAEFTNIKVNELYCTLESESINFTDVTGYVVDEATRNQIQSSVDKVKEVSDKISTSIDKANSYLELANTALTTAEKYQNGEKEKEWEDKYKDATNEELAKAIVDLTTQANNLYKQKDPASVLKAAELMAEVAFVAKKLAKQANQEYLGLAALQGRNVIFSAQNSETNYFDAYQTKNQFPKLYEQPSLPDSAGTYKYYVPYVAITPSANGAVATRKVIATVTVSNFDKTKLKFVSNSSVGQLISANAGVGEKSLVQKELTTTTFEVEVPSNAKQVYAIYDGLRIGKLNVVETPEITKTVVIVPSGSKTLNANTLETELNAIYKIPNVKFKVELATVSFTDKTWDKEGDGLNVEDHKFMSRTSKEMDDIESLYFAQTGVTAKDDSKYYLFVVDRIISAEVAETAHEVDGYMPRNKKVGFISSTSNTTIAHELGHGMFRLAHTWQLDESQAQGTTKNLMDYDKGTELIGAQWTQIQDPTFDIYGLDKIEDGMFDNTGCNTFFFKESNLIFSFTEEEFDQLSYLRLDFNSSFEYALREIKLTESTITDKFSSARYGDGLIIGQLEKMEELGILGIIGESDENKNYYIKDNESFVKNAGWYIIPTNTITCQDGLLVNHFSGTTCCVMSENCSKCIINDKASGQSGLSQENQNLVKNLSYKKNSGQEVIIKIDGVYYSLNPNGDVVKNIDSNIEEKVKTGVLPNNIESSVIVEVAKDGKINIKESALNKTLVDNSETLDINELAIAEARLKELEKRLIGEPTDPIVETNSLNTTERNQVLGLIGNKTGLAASQVRFTKTVNGVKKYFKVENNVVVEDESFDEANFLNGNWTDVDKRKYVFSSEKINGKDVLQTTFRMSNKVPVKSGKVMSKGDFKTLSEEITKTMNKKLAEVGATSGEQTLRQLGKSLNGDVPFFTEEKMNISLDASILKILDEAVGHTENLITNVEFLPSIYDETTSAIKSPGVLPGTLEPIAEEILGLLPLGIAAYNLMFEDSERKEMKTVQEDLTKDANTGETVPFYESAGNFLLETFTSLSEDKIIHLKANPNPVDNNKTQYIMTKASITTVLSVVMMSSLTKGVGKYLKDATADPAKFKAKFKATNLKANAMEQIGNIQAAAIDFKAKIMDLPQTTLDLITGSKLDVADLKDLDEIAKLPDAVPTTSTNKLDDAVKKFGCFAAGTPIYTKFGDKVIENIVVGDSVWSYNDSTAKRELKVVKHLKRTLFNVLFYVQLASGVTFATTPDHPFYINGKYVDAEKLTLHDSVTAFDGNKYAIAKLWQKDTSVTVYNFEVADNHNYYIGNEHVLVHNNDERCILGELREMALNGNQDLRNYYLSLNKERRLKFLEDCKANNFDLLDKIKANPNLHKAWDILSEMPQSIRANPANLEKLSRYVQLEGADINKLKATLANASDVQTWIDLKIPKSDLDNILSSNNILIDPPANLDPWTPKHKAQRWNNYKEGKIAEGFKESDLNFETWSNIYDGNINKALKGNQAVLDFADNINWSIPPVKNEFTQDLPLTVKLKDGTTVTGKRRHDLYDEDLGKAVEVKDYRNEKVYLSKDIQKEALMDIELLKEGEINEMEWVFVGQGPSGPLKALLDAPITTKSGKVVNIKLTTK